MPSLSSFSPKIGRNSFRLVLAFRLSSSRQITSVRPAADMKSIGIAKYQWFLTNSKNAVMREVPAGCGGFFSPHGRGESPRADLPPLYTGRCAAAREKAQFAADEKYAGACASFVNPAVQIKKPWRLGSAHSGRYAQVVPFV